MSLEKVYAFGASMRKFGCWMIASGILITLGVVTLPFGIAFIAMAVILPFAPSIAKSIGKKE